MCIRNPDDRAKMRAFVRDHFKAFNHLRKLCIKIDGQLSNLGPLVAVCPDFQNNVKELKAKGSMVFASPELAWMLKIDNPIDKHFFISKDFQNVALSMEYFTVIVESLCAQSKDVGTIEHWDEHTKPFRTSLSYLERNLTLICYELADYRY